MEFDWVMGCGLGWFVGPKFLLCDGLGWVWVGLKKLDPRTTMAFQDASKRTYFNVQFHFFFEGTYRMELTHISERATFSETQLDVGHEARHFKTRRDILRVCYYVSKNYERIDIQSLHKQRNERWSHTKFWRYIISWRGLKYNISIGG